MINSKIVDLLAAICAMVYTIVALIIGPVGLDIVDLGDYIVQPQISGSFALIAARRFYSQLKQEKNNE